MMDFIITLVGMIILSAANSYPNVHFLLNGESYTTNIALNLGDIGDNENTLHCVTSFTRCCRDNETGTGNALGSWKFPNGKTVESKSNSSSSIVRTRGLSSVILHRLKNESSPTGVYTCEIPDGAGNITKLFVLLYCEINPDLRVNISLNALNELYCTVHGGLVESYSWIVNGSLHSDGLFEENQIINFTTATSQLMFTDYSVDLVGTFQCCITDGLGRTSTDILPNEYSSRGSPQTTSSITEDSSGDSYITTSSITEDSSGGSNINAQETTSGVQAMSSSLLFIITTIAAIVSIVIITVPIILIIIFVYHKKSYAKKEEKLIHLQNKNSELLANNIVCDSSSLNEQQPKNAGSPVYSVVSDQAKKVSESKAGKGKEEKDNQMATYSSIVGSKEEVSSKDQMQDISKLYAVVDKCAKRKEKSTEEEVNSKDEMQDASNLYAVVDKSAKGKKKSTEEEVNSEDEMQDISLYAVVDKNAKGKEKSPEEITSLYATVNKL